MASSKSSLKIKPDIKKAKNLEDKISEMEITADILALTGILKGKVPYDIDVWDLKYEYLKEKYDL